MGGQLGPRIQVDVEPRGHRGQGSELEAQLSASARHLWVVGGHLESRAGAEPGEHRGNTNRTAKQTEAQGIGGPAKSMGGGWASRVEVERISAQRTGQQNRSSIDGPAESISI